MKNKKDSDIAWILIEDKLKKEWNKRNAYKEKKEEDKKNHQLQRSSEEA